MGFEEDFIKETLLDSISCLSEILVVSEMNSRHFGNKKTKKSSLQKQKPPQLAF